jgi:hypothetical protein
MANVQQFLGNFSHISAQVPGLKALASVELPAASGFRSILNSISGIFGNKRAAYVALGSQGLNLVQTVGTNVISQKAIAEAEIDKVKISNTNLAGSPGVELVSVAITTKKVTQKKQKDGTMLDDTQYGSESFNMMPIAFQANLKYLQSENEILSSAAMRKELVAYLNKFSA